MAWRIIGSVTGVAAIALVLVACGSERSGGDGDGDDDGGAGSGSFGATTGSGSSTFYCCLNDAKYSCPTKAALDQCLGFDLDGCLAACAPGNSECVGGCLDQLQNAAHDPSACQLDSSVDCGEGPGSTSGSTSSGTSSGSSTTSTSSSGGGQPLCVEGDASSCYGADLEWTGALCCVSAEYSACVAGSASECYGADQEWTGALCCIK